jgi:hypothetical protein
MYIKEEDEENSHFSVEYMGLLYALFVSLFLLEIPQILRIMREMDSHGRCSFLW